MRRYMSDTKRERKFSSAGGFHYWVTLPNIQFFGRETSAPANRGEVNQGSGARGRTLVSAESPERDYLH